MRINTGLIARSVSRRPPRGRSETNLLAGNLIRGGKIHNAFDENGCYCISGGLLIHCRHAGTSPTTTRPAAGTNWKAGWCPRDRHGHRLGPMRFWDRARPLWEPVKRWRRTHGGEPGQGGSASR